jgi:hypothetical protein
MLDHFDKILSIRDSKLLVGLLRMLKHVARARAGPRGNEAAPTIARWEQVRDRVLPRLPLTDLKRDAITKYVEMHWVDTKNDCFWMRAWYA